MEAQKEEELAAVGEAPAHSELEKEQRRHEQTRFKLRKAEGATHAILIFIRRLLREIITEVRKLQQRVNAEKKARRPPTTRGANKDTYLQESVGILDISLEDLQDSGGVQDQDYGNAELDCLLKEMDEIVASDGKEFSGEGLFKTFIILLEDKANLEA